MGKTKHKYLTPKTMWEHFESYRIEIKLDPFIIVDWVGGKGVQVERKKEKPLTMEGFENYLACKGVIKDISDYLSNAGGVYSDFVNVVARIRKVIRQDQIEGGMAGVYHHSITQRLNNLVEKTEVKVDNIDITMKL